MHLITSTFPTAFKMPLALAVASCALAVVSPSTSHALSYDLQLSGSLHMGSGHYPSGTPLPGDPDVVVEGSGNGAGSASVKLEPGVPGAPNSAEIGFGLGVNGTASSSSSAGFSMGGLYLSGEEFWSGGVQKWIHKFTLDGIASVDLRSNPEFPATWAAIAMGLGVYNDATGEPFSLFPEQGLDDSGTHWSTSDESEMSDAMVVSCGARFAGSNSFSKDFYLLTETSLSVPVTVSLEIAGAADLLPYCNNPPPAPLLLGSSVQINALPSVVPLPAGLPLLLSALVPLVLRRRRN